MRATTFTKFGIGLVAAAVAACTLVAPAYADPASDSFGTLVGVGSDTTQDVVNGLSTAIGGSGSNLRLASYDATGGQKITTRSGAAEIFRPNGSGAGRDVLRVAIGNLPSFAATVNNVPYSWTSADSIGAVDFARSSSGAPSADVASNGVLTYIPFGIDAVTYATSANTVLPALTKGSSSDTISAEGVGVASLWSIYHGRVTKIATATDGSKKAVNNSYVAAAGETLTKIDAYIPQAGSGTRSFWLTQVGLTETDITADGGVIVNDHYGANKALSVQEHDGAAVEGNPGAVTPFSIGQWVAQANSLPGVTDRRHTAVLGSLNGITPLAGAAGSYELNPAYNVITRKVYNIVPSAQVDDAGSKTNWMFVGTGSLICSQPATIKAYGFGLLTGTGSNACGDTSVRAFAPSESSVTLDTSKASLAYGGSFTATANVSSYGNGGGTVVFYNGDTVLSTVKVAKGKTSAVTTIKTTAFTKPTAYNLSAEFTPALSGVSDSATDEVSVAVTKATPVVKGTAATVSATKAPVVKVTVTATGVTVAGKVSVKEGSKTLKSNVTLSGGKATITLPKLKAGTHKLVVFYTASTTVNAGKSATITLKVAK